MEAMAVRPVNIGFVILVAGRKEYMLGLECMLNDFVLDKFALYLGVE